VSDIDDAFNVVSEIEQALAIINGVIEAHIEAAMAGDPRAIAICAMGIRLIATILRIEVKP